MSDFSVVMSIFHTSRYESLITVFLISFIVLPAKIFPKMNLYLMPCSRVYFLLKYLLISFLWPTGTRIQISPSSEILTHLMGNGFCKKFSCRFPITYEAIQWLFLILPLCILLFPSFMHHNSSFFCIYIWEATPELCPLPYFYLPLLCTYRWVQLWTVVSPFTCCFHLPNFTYKWESLFCFVLPYFCH